MHYGKYLVDRICKELLKMYYDVLINNACPAENSWSAMTEVETFEKVKCICKKEIKSIHYFVYVRKVEKEMITKWRLIFNLSDYFSNLHSQPDCVCDYLDDLFERCYDAK